MTPCSCNITATNSFIFIIRIGDWEGGASTSKGDTAGLTPRILRTVSIPESFLFFTDIGQYTGEFTSSLAEFNEKLRKVPLRSIEFHFKRGDFAKWIIDVLGDNYLAERISQIGGSFHGEELRTAIQRKVEERLNQLRGLPSKAKIVYSPFR